MAKSVANINVERVVGGGVVAGLILFGAAAMVNGGLYKTQWARWKDMMGNHIHAPAMNTSMILWFALNMMLGLLGVLLYASIRPRFGKGPKTAVLAGLLLWLASEAPALLDRKALGILPEAIVNGQFLTTLVSMLVAVYVGAWIYKE